ncbi:MAG: thioredoxin family protein [Candidatus Gygaella obscura]|nr:thioredoxin family protein [Candidatus Gygaella obscura]
MYEWVKDDKHLQQAQERHKEFLVLMFYADSSSNAKRALVEIEKFSVENKRIPVYVIDVGKTKGMHKQFEVKNVPTVLALREGKVTHRIEGVESVGFYTRIFCGIALVHKSGEKVISHRVVVYSGPGCPACGTAKAYLRKRGIGFRTVDIAQDQHAAERLVRRSGQMAVPQIDIDGHLVVGFDQVKIDRFLSN